jgi:hypothetical protein
LQFLNCLSAELIYQSGTLGPTGVTRDQLLSQQVSGTNVTTFSYVGARFHLADRYVTRIIGGHFVGGFDNSDFFGAIVKLTSGTDFPDSDDLSTADVLGKCVLTFPHPSSVTGTICVSYSSRDGMRLSSAAASLGQTGGAPRFGMVLI